MTCSPVTTGGFNFARFYGDNDLADVTVQLAIDQRRLSLEVSGTGRISICCRFSNTEVLPAHGIVLAECSPYFEAELTRWKQLVANIHGSGNGGSSSGGDSGHSTATSSIASSRHTITLLLNNASELDAARVMMEYIYHQHLPDDAAQPLLVDMLRLADRFDVQRCYAACAACLSTHKLHWDTVVQLLLSPAADWESTALKALRDSVTEQLQEQLGDLEEAWASSEGRERFLALPLKGVELLLRDPRTRVASENTVLVATSVWVEHHSECSTAANRTSLARLIRLPHITAFAGFTLALTLPWLGEALTPSVLAAGMGMAALVSRSNACMDCSVLISNNWPFSWRQGKRPASKRTKAFLEWKVSKEQLQHIYSCGELWSPAVELGGLQWHIKLSHNKACLPLQVMLAHTVDSSLKAVFHASGALSLPVTLKTASITAVRPANALGLKDSVCAFTTTTPSIGGFRADTFIFWNPGFLTQNPWNVRGFDSWLDSASQLTLQLEVSDFE